MSSYQFSHTPVATPPIQSNFRRIQTPIPVLESLPLLADLAGFESRSISYATQIRADYLRTLIAVTPPQFEKAFLLSAGTEATECALKLMRLHGGEQGKRCPGILTMEGNWHGRTLGAQMLSYNPAQKA